MPVPVNVPAKRLRFDKAVEADSGTIFVGQFDLRQPPVRRVSERLDHQFK